MTRKLSFEQAKAKYVHRYTMEHVPQWAKEPAPNGKHYAPQYSTDREWYDNTFFPGENGIEANDRHCRSDKQSWPLGQWLDTPYKDASNVKHFVVTVQIIVAATSAKDALSIASEKMNDPAGAEYSAEQYGA